MLDVEVKDFVRLTEVLTVDYWEVVVSFNWEDWDISEVLLKPSSKLFLVALNFLNGQVPLIMGHDVSSVEDDIGFDFSHNVLSHEVEGLVRQVTAVLSPLSSGVLR